MSTKKHAPPRKRGPGRLTLDDAAQLRERCLDAALDLFTTQGFHGTSIDEIARHADISRPTIYRHFETKHTLFRAAVLRAMEKLGNDIKITTSRTEPPEQVLRDLVLRIYTDFTAKETRAVVSMVIAESQRFPDIAAALYWNASTTLAPLARYLKHLDEEGILRIDDADLAALHFANLATGGNRFLIDKPLASREMKQQWVDSIVRLALDGWRADKNAKNKRIRS